jgi:adenosine deaminase
VEEQDFYDLMWAYLERAVRDNIVHAEIFFDPQSHTERGVSFETCFQGLYRATQVSVDPGSNYLQIRAHALLAVG